MFCFYLFLLQNLKKSIDEQKPNYESFVACEEPLVESAETDTDKVQSETETTKDRWNKLNVTWDERLDNLNKLNDKVKEIDEIIEPVEEVITCCEQTLENLAPIGLDKDKGHEQIADLEVRNFINISIRFFLKIIVIDDFYSILMLFLL